MSDYTCMRGSYGQMEPHPSDDGLITKRMCLQYSDGSLKASNINECVMARLLMKHPLPSVIGYRAVRASRATGTLLIDQERGVHGTLNDFIVAQPFAERICVLRPILTGLAQGLAGLHRMGVVHGDFKAANVVMTAESGVRIIDLGACQFIRSCPAGTHNRACTYTSAPPEMFDVGPPHTADTLPKTDAYSLGVLMYEFIFQMYYIDGSVTPYDGHDAFRAMHIRGGPPMMPRPRTVPADMYAIMCRLLDRNAFTRLGVGALYELLTEGTPTFAALQVPKANKAFRWYRQPLRLVPTAADVQLVSLCTHRHTRTLAMGVAHRFMIEANRKATAGEITACAAIATSLYQYHDVDHVKAAVGDVLEVLCVLDFELPGPL